jgi:hypothetical protein
LEIGLQPLQVALSAEAVGICVVPPREDGSKRPIGDSWGRWQRERPTPTQLREWYAQGRSGVGWVCGDVSGNLEMFEFDDVPTYHAFREAADAVGQADLVERIESGCSETTPRGGVHWFYRCSEIAGNTKLACRPGPPDNSVRPRVETLIETRGNGGYAIVAPSNGKVHPTGKPYTMLRGGVETIATISPDGRAALHRLASTFDEMPVQQAERSPEPQLGQGERPGDDYNRRGDWRDLLERHGWTWVYRRGETDYWRRPGKDQGVSATTNHAGSGFFYVFSTSTVFESERGYSRFSAYALLEHGKDYAAAASALAAQGYGRTATPSHTAEVVSEGMVDDAKKSPVIYASIQDLPTITAQCWEAVQQANQPPYLFRHGNVPCRLEQDDRGAPMVRELNLDRARHELARVARWVSKKQIGGVSIETDAKPPLDVVKDWLATPNPRLPVLNRIVESPVFAPDGTLQTGPGYHSAARTYYVPAHGFTLPEVPSKPTPDDVAEAKALILDDLLVDFPFVVEEKEYNGQRLTVQADRAHAVGLLLLPFVRGLIDGPTPNHLVEAPGAGTGKSLLADIVLMPSIGRNIGVVTETRDDDELRKRITAILREAHAAVLFDNVGQPLTSGTLAAALTAVSWEDRILGRNESINVPVNCVWVTTANNPTMTTEIARRSVRIRLDSLEDRPWQRQGFKHHDLRRWVAENRAVLVWSALTLVQAWIAAGRPSPKAKPLGSYEQWTEVVGGILENAGIPDFLANLHHFYEASDVEGAAWRTFVQWWWDRCGDREVGVSELFAAEQANGYFDLGRGGERSQRIVFGKLLGRQRGRVIGDFRIVEGKTEKRASQWRLLRLDSNTHGVNVVNVDECLALT